MEAFRVKNEKLEYFLTHFMSLILTKSLIKMSLKKEITE